MNIYKEIPELLERNIFAIYMTVAKNAKKRYFESGVLKWTDVRPSGWPNFIFDLDTQMEIDKLIELAMIEISEGRAPESIFLGPSSYSSDMHMALEEKGFELQDEYPGMFIVLEGINLGLEPDGPFIVKTVESKKGLEAFSSIIKEGMFGDSFEGTRMLKGFLGSGDSTMLIGYFEGIPVSTSLLFYDDNIAGIKLVTTRLGYRKNGFAHKMMEHALDNIEKRGYKIAGLFASEMGVNIYKDLGFKKCCNFYKFVR